MWGRGWQDLWEPRKIRHLSGHIVHAVISSWIRPSWLKQLDDHWRITSNTALVTYRPCLAAASSGRRRDLTWGNEARCPEESIIWITQVMGISKNQNRTIISFPTVGAMSMREVIQEISSWLAFSLSPKRQIVFMAFPHSFSYNNRKMSDVERRLVDMKKTRQVVKAKEKIVFLVSQRTRKGCV